ncbi:MAG: ribose 5-phosphate isomerase B [Ignavibacteria bacterium]|nr:MAG: ribose 5-phosphate isomerase B [Ignavibacteria bacterium]
MTPKRLVSEQTILEAAKRGDEAVTIGSDSIVTDAAKDRAKQLGVRLVSKKKDEPVVPSSSLPLSPKPASAEIVAIGSDHGGFALKNDLKSFVEGLGYRVVDVGTYTDKACDYPDFAYGVARMVSLGEASKGIMIDAVGIASAIAANKVHGVRAACCPDEFSARSSREHNNANVLTLGGRILGLELAKSIVKVWLETSFGGGRHQKRLDKITDIENRSAGGAASSS